MSVPRPPDLGPQHQGNIVDDEWMALIQAGVGAPHGEIVTRADADQRIVPDHGHGLALQGDSPEAGVFEVGEGGVVDSQRPGQPVEGRPDDELDRHRSADHRGSGSAAAADGEAR